MAKEQIVWENKGVQQLRFEEPGQTFEGYLTQIETGPGFDDQMRNIYTFQNDEGLHILFGSVVLDRQLQNGEVGGYFRITFQGTEKTERGFNVKIYKVEQGLGMSLPLEDE